MVVKISKILKICFHIKIIENKLEKVKLSVKDTLEFLVKFTKWPFYIYPINSHHFQIWCRILSFDIVRNLEENKLCLHEEFDRYRIPEFVPKKGML